MKYKSIANEPEPTNPDGESCGHAGAAPHVYTSCGITATLINCPTCHERLTDQFAVIATVKVEIQHHAHAVAARALQIGLKPKSVLRVLRALAKISNQNEKENEPFIMAWPHWCWDNFHPGTGTALAFPTEDVPEHLSEPGLGGRRCITTSKSDPNGR
ncbi:MAG: hypothetical protein ABSB50_16565 [Terracidiphilus sp.]|jgi:hypothetical protein